MHNLRQQSLPNMILDAFQSLCSASSEQKCLLAKEVFDYAKVMTDLTGTAQAYMQQDIKNAKLDN